MCAHALQAGNLEIQFCWSHICGEGITVVICMHCCFPAAQRLNTWLQPSIHFLAHGCVKQPGYAESLGSSNVRGATFTMCFDAQAGVSSEMMNHCACLLFA